MPIRTVKLMDSQNLWLERLVNDANNASASLRQGVLLCLRELGVPEKTEVNVDELLRTRSFSWEVPDAPKQPNHRPEVEGV
jgi:hypothetical protein